MVNVKVKRMNPELSQWRASADAEHKNIRDQRPGSNSSVKKLLPFIFKIDVH